MKAIATVCIVLLPVFAAAQDDWLKQAASKNAVRKKAAKKPVGKMPARKKPTRKKK